MLRGKKTRMTVINSAEYQRAYEYPMLTTWLTCCFIGAEVTW